MHKLHNLILRSFCQSAKSMEIGTTIQLPNRENPNLILHEILGYNSMLVTIFLNLKQEEPKPYLTQKLWIKIDSRDNSL